MAAGARAGPDCGCSPPARGSRLRGSVGALAGGARAAASPRRWRDARRELAALPATLRRELWPLGADTAFDRRIGGDREVAFTACELDDLKRIEHAAGQRGDRQRRRAGRGRGGDPALVGRSPRAACGRCASRSRSACTTEARAPTSSATATRSCSATCRSRSPTRESDWRPSTPRPSSRKQHHDADELYSFFHSLSHVRPLYRVASELASGPREFALSVSNVPGPREPVHVLTGRVAELYSVAEPADRHALRASAVSLAGRMGFGFCTDPGAVPGVAELAAGLDASLAGAARR